MATVEFLEGHFVAAPLQLRHDDAAALIDRQNLIGFAVRRERTAVFPAAYRRR